MRCWSAVIAYLRGPPSAAVQRGEDPSDDIGVGVLGNNPDDDPIQRLQCPVDVAIPYVRQAVGLVMRFVAIAA